MKRSFLKKNRLVSLFAALTVVGCAYGMEEEVSSPQNGDQLPNGNVHHEQAHEQPRPLTWPEWFERFGEALRAAVDAIPDK